METKPGIVPPYLERAAEIISREEKRSITLSGLQAEPPLIQGAVQHKAAEAMIMDESSSPHPYPPLRRAGDALLKLSWKNYERHASSQRKLKNSK